MKTSYLHLEKGAIFENEKGTRRITIQCQDVTKTGNERYVVEFLHTDQEEFTSSYSYGQIIRFFPVYVSASA